MAYRKDKRRLEKAKEKAEEEHLRKLRLREYKVRGTGEEEIS